MTDRRLIIHVFSGTGNSLLAADWLADFFGKEKSEIVRIGRQNVPQPNPAAFTGVVFPTHGFTAPWAVIRHAARLPRGAGSPAFVVATRGSTCPGILLPGLSAGAMYMIALILLLKGYSIRGLRGLDMPSNWMSLHWGLSANISETIVGRARADIALFASRIFRAKNHLLTFNNIVELLFGVILLPVSAGYLLIGRFALAKLFYANWKCDSCGRCARDCPFQAIIMKGPGTKKPYWTFACESCMHCMAYCPKAAVEASHPLAVAFYYISTFSFASALGTLLVSFDPAVRTLGNALSNSPLKSFVNYSYILFSFFFTYLLFYYLVRIPVINRVFTCFTLTHYYRRYRGPL